MTQYEQWIKRNNLVLKLSPSVMKESPTRLVPQEHYAYVNFIKVVIGALATNLPSWIPQDHAEAEEHIRFVMNNIKAYRLRRFLPRLDPLRALFFADTINRMGTDKLYWEFTDDGF